jgi:ABC-type lipoprotein release transport system permease subunit
LPIIGYFVCWQFNALEICQPSKVKEFAEQRCKFGKELEESDAISPDLDNLIESVDNISKQLNEQLKMNVSFLSILLLFMFLISFSAALYCRRRTTRGENANFG